MLDWMYNFVHTFVDVLNMIGNVTLKFEEKNGKFELNKKLGVALKTHPYSLQFHSSFSPSLVTLVFPRYTQ